MKKAVFAVLALVAIGAIGSLLYFKGRRYEVVISQDKIDATLLERFPIEKSYLILIRVTFSDPVATLLPESNRVRVGMKAELDIKRNDQEEKIGGIVSVLTGVRYDPQHCQFFLEDPQIEKVEIQGVPPGLSDRVAKAVLSLSKEHLESFPIYTIRAEDVKKSIARMLLKDFQVRDGAIHLSLGI